MVAVCRECSGRHPHPKEVRGDIRSELKAAGHKRRARVVLTGCLDLCPKKAVAVVVARTVGERAVTCHVVSDDGGLDDLVTDIAGEVTGGAQAS